MAKPSSRFRYRKLNPKARIPVRLYVSEDEIEALLMVAEDDGAAEDPTAPATQRVETGVDKDEEGEWHLQAILRRGTDAAGPRKQDPSIPTPDRAGSIDPAVFRRLYPLTSYVDPTTYIRFSDTVEESIKGSLKYTMDEDDEEWLEDYNKARPEHHALSDTLFEYLMEFFEDEAEERAPMLHTDLAQLPSLATMERSFPDFVAARPFLVPLLKERHLAFVYAHWARRKTDAGGLSIIPQLDFDESNDNNPYVCFRRREAKSTRKTRKTDTQSVERLARLRNDLHALQALTALVRERETTKATQAAQDRRAFELRVTLRQLKRRAGEPDGDEDLLIPHVPPPRKRVTKEYQPHVRLSYGAAHRAPAPAQTHAAVFSARKLVTQLDELRARAERAALAQAKIDRALFLKKDQDSTWEDSTDTGYSIGATPISGRYWRAIEPASLGGSPFLYSFASNHQAAVGHIRPSFRKRVGRGGRMWIDRVHPYSDSLAWKLNTSRSSFLAQHFDRTSNRPVYEDLDAENNDPIALQKLVERARYDNDFDAEFSGAAEPAIIDDYAVPQLVTRAKLMSAFESPSSTYLEDTVAQLRARAKDSFTPPAVTDRSQPLPTPLAPHRYEPALTATSAAAHHVTHQQQFNNQVMAQRNLLQQHVANGSLPPNQRLNHVQQLQYLQLQQQIRQRQQQRQQ